MLFMIVFLLASPLSVPLFCFGVFSHTLVRLWIRMCLSPAGRSVSDVVPQIFMPLPSKGMRRGRGERMSGILHRFTFVWLLH